MTAKEYLKSKGYSDHDYMDSGMIDHISEMMKEYHQAKQCNIDSVSGSNLYTAEQVKQLIIECCGEVYSEDGALKGKSPAELYKWIESKEL